MISWALPLYELVYLYWSNLHKMRPLVGSMYIGIYISENECSINLEGAVISSCEN